MHNLDLDLNFLYLTESKGKSHYLLKAGSKRRRTKVEILESKEEERLRQEGEDRKAAHIRELEEHLQNLRQEQQANSAAAQILQGFIDAGKAEHDGQGGVVLREQVDQASASRPQAAPQ